MTDVTRFSPFILKSSPYGEKPQNAVTSVTSVTVKEVGPRQEQERTRPRPLGGARPFQSKTKTEELTEELNMRMSNKHHHYRPAAQAQAMIVALRYALPAGVSLQIGLLPHVGTTRQGAVQTLQLPLGADPEPLLRQARGAQMRADAQVYVRPDPVCAHGWLLVDDLPEALALDVGAQKAALVIRTSTGNCQLRLLADRPLSVEERAQCQRGLVARLGGDPGSIAGDKWGRLAGYTNRKPTKLGQWTELLCDSTTSCPPARSAALLGLAVVAGVARAPAPAFVSPRLAGAAVSSPAPALGRPAARAGDLALADPTRGWTDRWAAALKFACASIRRNRLSDDAIIAQMAGWLLDRGKRKTESEARRLAESLFVIALRLQPRR